MEHQAKKVNSERQFSDSGKGWENAAAGEQTQEQQLVR